MFSINQSFNSYEEMMSHITYIQHFQKYQEKKKQTLAGEEKRGGHMRGLHEKAKAYHALNPTMTYKKCLKIVSSPTNI
jgi:hypothetical protein